MWLCFNVCVHVCAVVGQPNSEEDGDDQKLSTVIQGYMAQIEELK